MTARYDLTDEQRLFKDAIGDFLTDRYDHAARNRIIASNCGWSPEIWHAFANELGLLGATFDEAYGGLAGDAIMQLLIMEAFGDALVVEPYLDTVVIAGGFLKATGGPVAESMIPAIIAGQVRCAFAYLEPHARFAPHNVAVRAEPRGEDFILSGEKSMVVGAPWATHFVVTARTSGLTDDRDGISLFLIDADMQGVGRRDFATIDGQRASELTFSDAIVPGSALLGAQGAALPVIERIIDEATAAVCAEAVGIMRRLLRDTLSYLIERRQFGSALADFQVLQHRMADVFASIELASSMAFRASHALGADASERGATVSAAKAYIGNAAQMVAQSAVQLHGAMGMTEEFPVGHRFKRITTILSQFGSTEYHLGRFARLGGSALLFGSEMGSSR